MFPNISHADGLVDPTVDEILFNTRFGYMFPDLTRSPDCLLTPGADTVAALNALGDAMADPGDSATPAEEFDSDVPAIFTYLGQFIDHDITARTDREGELSEIGANHEVAPLDPDAVVDGLRNGRRPQLDLDSVFGDGPGMVSGVATQAQGLYHPATLRLNVFKQGNRVDLPRQSGKAVIADMRNDENVIVGQLHAAFLLFYNKVLQRQRGAPKRGYVRARQLVRWAYQHVVINEYLPEVCDPDVVADVLANGPRYMGPTAGEGSLYMPLEFSVAGFRFGHSMIRPFYDLNSGTRKDIVELLDPAANPDNLANGQLVPELAVDWDHFAPGGNSQQHARLIDTKIAQGLFALPFGGGDAVLAHLARRNLLRAYNLSIPTGQAVAKAMRVEPLSAEDIVADESQGVCAALEAGGFGDRTPLWFYLLKEAAVQQNGRRLGEVGSRMVAETLVNLVKQDPNSYLNNRDDRAVSSHSIDVIEGFGGRVDSISDILRLADVF